MTVIGKPKVNVFLFIILISLIILISFLSYACLQCSDTICGLSEGRPACKNTLPIAKVLFEIFGELVQNWKMSIRMVLCERICCVYILSLCDMEG